MFHTNLVRYMRIKEKTPKDFYNNKDPLLNISESQFGRIKSGKVQPSTAHQIKIAKVLGVSPLDLMRHEPKLKLMVGDRTLKKTIESFDAEELKRTSRKNAIISTIIFLLTIAWLLMLTIALLS